jgi:hypothetical protein
MKKDRIKKAWELFNSMIKKFELYPVESTLRSYPKINEVRELVSNLPLYFVLVEQFSFDDQNKIFKCLILSEEIILGYLNQKTPIVRLSKYRTVLIVLPIWCYFNEQFLSNYTKRIGKIKKEESEKLMKYAEETRIPSDVRGKFINSIMKLLSSYNTEAILESLNKIEETSFVIRIPDELKRYFEEKYK